MTKITTTCTVKPDCLGCWDEVRSFLRDGHDPDRQSRRDG